MLKREVAFTVVWLAVAVVLVYVGLRPRTETYALPDGTVIVLKEQCTRVGGTTTCQMVKVRSDPR